MSKSIGFMVFTLGAAIGSVIAWRYAKQKYEQIAQEEIESVKEAFDKRGECLDGIIVEKDENVNIIEKVKQTKEKPPIVEYTNRLHRQGYANYSDISIKGKKEVQSADMNTDKPYVISPDEFGEIDEYEKIGLTYYADRVLTDDDDGLITDVESIVGVESLNSF